MSIAIRKGVTICRYQQDYPRHLGGDPEAEFGGGGSVLKAFRSQVQEKWLDGIELRHAGDTMRRCFVPT